MQELGRFLEKAKCKLALAVDFNLGDLFRFFGLGESPAELTKGWIDCSDVARVARYLGVLPNTTDDSLSMVKAFVKQLDGDGDGQLLFTDLSRAFLSSLNEEYQRLVIDRPTFYDKASRLD